MDRGAAQRLLRSGPKNFDFDINQISITRPRAKQVDFSVPYYTTPQAVVVGKGSKYARARTFSELSDARFGVRRGHHRASTP